MTSAITMASDALQVAAGYRLNHRARAKIHRAADVLVRLMPFHAELMAGWTVKEDSSIETCGLWWEQAALQLRYAPEWIDRITLAELCGQLVHEVLHVLFGHIYLVADESVDRQALLIAMETTVNEFVRSFPLPDEPLLLEQFPRLAPLQSTMVRYRLLARNPQGRAGEEQHPKNTNKSGETLGDSPRVCDHHEGWESIRTAGTVAKVTITAAVQEALRKHPASVDSELAESLGDANSTAGTAPGVRSERVQSTSRAWLDWRSVLAHLPPPKQVNEPTLARPPRRRPELVGIVPGKRRVSRPPLLLVAIDVSSSMSREILGWIKYEVRALAELFRIAVIEIDVRVQRKLLLFDDGDHRPELIDDQAHGRGGTCFDAAFTPGILAWAGGDDEVDAVIYFTDGFGPPPKTESPVPTIWILADEHDRVRTPAPWGTVVGTDGRILRQG